MTLIIDFFIFAMFKLLSKAVFSNFTRSLVLLRNDEIRIFTEERLSQIYDMPFLWWDPDEEENVPDAVLKRLQQQLFLDSKEYEIFKRDQGCAYIMKEINIHYLYPELNNIQGQNFQDIQDKYIYSIENDESHLPKYLWGKFKYTYLSREWRKYKRFQSNSVNPNLIQHLHIELPVRYDSKVNWDWLDENCPNRIIIKFCSPSFNFKDYMLDSLMSNYNNFPDRRKIDWDDYISCSTPTFQEQTNYIRTLMDYENNMMVAPKENNYYDTDQLALYETWSQKFEDSLGQLVEKTKLIQPVNPLKPEWKLVEETMINDKKVKEGYVKVADECWYIRGWKPKKIKYENYIKQEYQDGILDDFYH